MIIINIFFYRFVTCIFKNYDMPRDVRLAIFSHVCIEIFATTFVSVIRFGKKLFVRIMNYVALR